MNRAAVGLGSWLLQSAQDIRAVSIDTQEGLLELKSFSRWCEEELGRETQAGRKAMHTLVREVWREALSGQERQVLRATLLEGKSVNELARELGMHHSVVGRCKKRAEEKLKGGLHYVMRYRALLEQSGE